MKSIVLLLEEKNVVVGLFTDNVVLIAPSAKIPNLTKSVNVVLIRLNDTIGSSFISMKGISCLNSSVNDVSGESLVDIPYLF